MQRGSIAYFQKLGDNWPTDTATAKRALAALLGHLKLEHIPQIKPGPHLEDLKKDAIDNIARSLASIKILPAGFKCFETAPVQDKQEVFEMVEAQRVGVFGWIRFLVRNVTSILADPQDPATLPLATIAIMLRSLVELCRTHWVEYHFHQVMIQVSLEIWVVGAERRKLYPPLDVHEYYRAAVPILQLFSECVADPPFDSMMINDINQRGKTWTRNFANAFILHCQQYAAAYRDYPDTSQSTNGLVGMQAGARLLARARRFYKLLTEEYKFPSVVLRLSLELSLVLSEPGDASLAIEVASQALRPQGPNAYEHTHVLPQLLAAGYLNIIVQDLSSPRKLGAYPFPNWPCANPLAQLYIACFHPRISSAVKLAVDKIPPALLSRITLQSDSFVHQAWDNFTYGSKLYETAYSSASADDIELCDNFLVATSHLCLYLFPASYTPVQHYQRLPSAHAGNSVECSWCHSVVYCSARCQREDWDDFHRDECSSSRVRRIGVYHPSHQMELAQPLL